MLDNYAHFISKINDFTLISLAECAMGNSLWTQQGQNQGKPFASISLRLTSVTPTHEPW